MQLGDRHAVVSKEKKRRRRSPPCLCSVNTMGYKHILDCASHAQSVCSLRGKGRSKLRATDHFRISLKLEPQSECVCVIMLLSKRII